MPRATLYGDVEMAVAPWKPGQELQAHAEGLRERLLTYFEVNNLNLKKPKLVALTGCEPGSGVTTLASGFADAHGLPGRIESVRMPCFG